MDIQIRALNIRRDEHGRYFCSESDREIALSDSQRRKVAMLDAATTGDKYPDSDIDIDGVGARRGWDTAVYYFLSED